MFKDPITDSTKISKKGLLKLHIDSSQNMWYTGEHSANGWENCTMKDYLKLVFLDGFTNYDLHTMSLENIRQRARLGA